MIRDKKGVLYDFSAVDLLSAMLSGELVCFVSLRDWRMAVRMRIKGKKIMREPEWGGLRREENVSYADKSSANLDTPQIRIMCQHNIPAQYTSTTAYFLNSDV